MSNLAWGELITKARKNKGLGKSSQNSKSGCAIFITFPSIEARITEKYQKSLMNNIVRFKYFVYMVCKLKIRDTYVLDEDSLFRFEKKPVISKTLSLSVHCQFRLETITILTIYLPQKQR